MAAVSWAGLEYEGKKGRVRPVFLAVWALEQSQQSLRVIPAQPNHLQGRPFSVLLCPNPNQVILFFFVMIKKGYELQNGDASASIADILILLLVISLKFFWH